jgi:hypothetical protein
LYHQRLKRRLSETVRVNLKVRIARDFEKEPVVRLASLVAENSLDAVMLHVRSAFVGKASLVTIAPTPAEFRYYLHPFLFRPWHSGWAEVQNADFAGCVMLGRRKNPVTTPSTGGENANSAGSVAERKDWGDTVPGATRIAGVSIRDLFFLGGSLCGLDSWAIRDELRMLQDVRAQCEELELPLFVLGPSRRPDNFWLDRLCKKLDARLREECSKHALPYCDLMRASDQRGRRMYRADGFHFTEEGHGYCAEQLAGVLEPSLGSERSSESSAVLSNVLARI